MKQLLQYLLVFVFLVVFTINASAQANYKKITNYRAYYGWAKHYPQDWMITRQFVNDGKSYFLLVNPQTLETKIDEPDFYQVKPMTIEEARAFFKATPYIKALQK